jgi:hypothetical protein
VDHACVEPERGVVEEETAADRADVDAPFETLEGGERADRIVPVETDVACEVVPRTERDRHERKVARDRSVRDRRERPVPARDAERRRASVGGRGGELGGVLPRTKLARLDPEPARGGGQLDCAGLGVA